MSRWFPDPVVLRLGDAVTPDSAAGCASEVGVAGGATSAPDRPASMLSTFERDLDERALPRGTRVTCVVGGEGARLRIVPWCDELSGPSQRQLLAQQSFFEAYGEPARGWTVVLHTRGHGVPALACAIDRRLLEGIDASMQARRLRLHSVQPALMHAFNAAAGQLRGGLFWFALVEDRWATLLLMSPREPLLVKRLPVVDGELGAPLDREWFALGMEVPRCPVYVAMSPGVAGGAHNVAAAGWSVVPLTPSSEVGARPRHLSIGTRRMAA